MNRYFGILPFPFWYLIAGALIFSIVVAGQSYLYAAFTAEKTGEFRWSTLMAVVPFVNFFFWALLSPIVFRLSRKIHVTDLRWKPVAAVVMWGLLLSSAHEFVSSMAYYIPTKVIAEGHSMSELFMRLDLAYFSFAISTRILEFLVILVVFVAITFYREFMHSRINLERTRNELQEARFQALKMKLQPHFLFNTLNSIASLIDEDKQVAQQMVAQLGGLLRSILEHGDRTTVRLEEELEFVRNYLSIEQVRFADRLLVNYKIDRDANEWEVPNLILQPVVENCIKHGFATKKDQCIIHITASSDGGKRIQICDNGDGTESRKSNGTGVGLTSIRERLHQHYGDKAELHIDTTTKTGFCVNILIYD